MTDLPAPIASRHYPRALAVYGDVPAGTAKGHEVHVVVHEDDTELVVTRVEGWASTDVVRLTGPRGRAMLVTVAAQLLFGA